ncbi:hypothetical protein CAP48_10120 [Advenella sp. S44]|uniref:hypothetical protein n=1 Tax=Advenella sp. S44 TaxID=1982755 RepID=UPI000C298032|nr:hypothetical protein [Advenella sp. S44]PJX26338.1 hypothetical protein CAP48_10120 [Advenella sp. S44]
MPYRRRQIDISNKSGPEFDYWLKSNISDNGYRNWYRTDRLSREQWLDKMEADIRQDKLEKDRREKWKQHW